MFELIYKNNFKTLNSLKFAKVYNWHITICFYNLQNLIVKLACVLQAKYKKGAFILFNKAGLQPISRTYGTTPVL